MNYQNRFDGKGEIYAKARPKYATSLFEYFATTLHITSGSTFADIGSGTGIFTEQLLQQGYKVYAVEPSPDMRRKAEEKLAAYEDFISVDGSDEHMNLPDKSVDHITAAQAFHWFNSENFKNECRRVLRPGGKIIIAYNSRDEEAGCTRALKEIRYKYSPDFHGFSNGISHEKCISFFDGKCDVFRADNSQVYDRQGYINRVLSSSYSLKEDDERYADYLGDINKIFDMFMVDGKIMVPTNTVAYIGSIL